MVVEKIYELSPIDGRKSFYGKARVYHSHDKKGNQEILVSYTTPVVIKEGGKLYKAKTKWTLENNWSQTTARHIKAYCGLNRQEFYALPYFRWPIIESWED